MFLCLFVCLFWSLLLTLSMLTWSATFAFAPAFFLPPAVLFLPALHCALFRSRTPRAAAAMTSRLSWPMTQKAGKKRLSICCSLMGEPTSVASSASASSCLRAAAATPPLVSAPPSSGAETELANLGSK